MDNSFKGRKKNLENAFIVHILIEKTSNNKTKPLEMIMSERDAQKIS